MNENHLSVPLLSVDPAEWQVFSDNMEEFPRHGPTPALCRLIALVLKTWQEQVHPTLLLKQEGQRPVRRAGAPLTWYWCNAVINGINVLSRHKNEQPKEVSLSIRMGRLQINSERMVVPHYAPWYTFDQRRFLGYKPTNSATHIRFTNPTMCSRCEYNPRFAWKFFRRITADDFLVGWFPTTLYPEVRALRVASAATFNYYEYARAALRHMLQHPQLHTDAFAKIRHELEQPYVQSWLAGEDVAYITRQVRGKTSTLGRLHTLFREYRAMGK